MFLLPIRDHNPSTRTPYVTWILIAINIAVFVTYWPLLQDERKLFLFFQDWAAVPVLISHGENPHTLLTSVFLHAGVLHLAGNMLFLWIFGDNMEDELGHLGYLAFYLASGAGASLIHVLSASASQTPLVGASGAIAGVMGGYLLLFPRARIDILLVIIFIFRIVPVPAWCMLGLWFGLQLFNVFNGAVSGGGGVAYWAHAGGFVIGLVLMLPVWMRRGAAAFWGRTHGHPPNPDARYRFARTGIPAVRNRRLARTSIPTVGRKRR